MTSDSKPIRIGFQQFPVPLLGMQNYLRNLFAAIDGLPGRPLQPILFAGTKTGPAPKDYIVSEQVTTPLLDHKSPAWWLRKAIHKLTGRDLLIERLLRRHGIALFSHSFSLGDGSSVKSMNWIADLQHFRLPEIFSAEEITDRNRSFGALCVGCEGIIVGSEVGLHDLREFSPANAGKGRVLHFVASPAAAEGVPSLEELHSTYNFTGPFFLLPNQFWPHKNHRVVVDALCAVRERGERVTVLATGSTKGREERYFPELMEHVAACGVEDTFRVLGVIPFPHLVGLMQHALALVNPSRFEGWSTSVEESKSMGKTVLLSDIPVHREQAPARGVYFSPDDPGALSDALIRTQQVFSLEADAAAQTAAAAEYPARLRAFGERYLALVREVLG